MLVQVIHITSQPHQDAMSGRRSNSGGNVLRNRGRLHLCLLGLFLLAPLGVQGQRIVTPSSGLWSADTRGSNGSVAITGINPRSGNGSLELHTTGDLNDWAFFNLFSGDPSSTGGWGQLADLTLVQFDWWRSSYTPVNDAVWQAQTPVTRLYVRSGDPANPVFSEIVWEQWYT